MSIENYPIKYAFDKYGRPERFFKSDGPLSFDSYPYDIVVHDDEAEKVWKEILEIYRGLR